jgi:hypothetical protein
MNATTSAKTGKPTWLLALGLITGVLLVFFWRSFDPDLVHFSNDGPLGAEMVESLRFPGAFTGVWYDLNVLGGEGGAYPPGISALMLWLLGPLGYSKFAVPLVLWLAGICSFFFFRNLRLLSAAAILGALAVALNSDFFSTACWGVGSQTAAFGLNFLALGLIMASERATNPVARWLRIALAGMAVGMNVVEAFDIGALFSLLVAAYVVYESWNREGSLVAGFLHGAGRVVVVAGFALFIAASTIFILYNTAISGIAGTKQDAETKAQHYNWATQWSLPKREALDVVVGGLFGYRMDGADGANYWGRVGSDPNLDNWFANGHQGSAPEGYMRFRGTGEYAGLPVVLVGLWAAIQSFRRKNSSFPLEQRRLLWFWSVVALVSLLLAFGRFAPFYQILYALPYFSTMRNPVKFMHIFSFALLVLFGYGVDGLWRKYVRTNLESSSGIGSRLKKWWPKAGVFEKRWVWGCILLISVSFLSWLIYASSRPSLEQYLQVAGFADPALAKSIASFSIGQVTWYLAFLGLSCGFLILLFSGAFAGPRSRWAGLLLGCLMFLDLGRADINWVKYWNYREKYATNPIIDFLRDKPYEHRVAMLPFQTPQTSLLNELYRIEWAQHQFLYYNVQSLDIVQMPRMPEDLAAFEAAIRYDGTPSNLFRITRRWQLTNTRYFLGLAAFRDVLNQQLDPGAHRFRIVTNFDIGRRPGVPEAASLEQLTAYPKPDGPYALMEFTGALPRAKLYSSWQVSTNDQKTLEELGSREFDPTQKVLVDNPLPVSKATNVTSQAAATVDYTSYAPKHFVLQAKADSPTVLLVNDKFDENWKVWVDGKPDTLFRCNYIMRGVYLPAGSHTVDFRFLPAVRPFYVSLTAIGLGILLIGILPFVDRPEPLVPSPQPATRQPAESSAR